VAFKHKQTNNQTKKEKANNKTLTAEKLENYFTSG